MTKREDIFWFTGFSGSAGLFLQLRTGERFLMADGRYSETAKILAKQNDVEFLLLDENFSENFGQRFSGDWAMEDSTTFGQLSKFKKMFPLVDFLPQHSVCAHLRRQKNPTEIASIRTAQQHVDHAMLPFLKAHVREGMTERELAFRLECELRAGGRFDLSFPVIIAFGENSAHPHHEPTERALAVGDNILVDCGVKFQHYCSDMTRNFVFRGASEEFHKKYDELLAAQKDAFKKYLLGAKVSEIEESVRMALGLDREFFPHSLGHGVGLEIHESPHISQKSEHVLQENEVVTCEPGIYFPGRFGIRIEDLLVIRKDHAELLSRTTKELVIL